MRRPRAWRITMWTSLAATVLLAGAVILNRGTSRTWFGQRGWYVGLADGFFMCGFDESTARTGRLNARWATLQPMTWWEFNSYSAGWHLIVSLWIPTGATFAVFALSAFMVHRTGRRRGHCPNCGYDRAGLPTDAPCPECGKVRA